MLVFCFYSIIMKNIKFIRGERIQLLMLGCFLPIVRRKFSFREPTMARTT